MRIPGTFQNDFLNCPQGPGCIQTPNETNAAVTTIAAFLYFAIYIITMRTILTSVILIISGFSACAQQPDNRFLSYTADSQTANITLYWKDSHGQPLKSLQNLKKFVEDNNKKLVFAMNAGMYRPDNSPQGLFIENGVLHKPLDTLSGSGNFYLKPNGVFYITDDNRAVVCQRSGFTDPAKVKFATQSGPMLLIDGNIHPAFKEGSANLNIRNGVGILPDNRVIFAVSKEAVNFYDFAQYFLSMGCKNALYLDGFVSRTYLPAQNWIQLDGNFGVMIGVSE